jgi:hypothetical protein
MIRRKIFSLLVVLVLPLFASTAMAYDIDFGMVADASDTGSISYAGSSGPLVGEDIDVDQVSLLGGGDIHPLTGAVLNFQTGNLTNFDPGVGYGRMWTFGGGGYISITAEVNGETVPLLLGTWDSAKVIETSESFKLEVAVGGFTDDKNKWLLYELELITEDPGLYESVGPFVGSLNLSFKVHPTDTGETFSSLELGSGDVINTPVPIPGALWLLGSGIIGLIGVRRKVKK